MSDIQQILIDAANRMKQQQSSKAKPVEDDKQKRIDYLTTTLERLRSRRDSAAEMSDELLMAIPDMVVELEKLTRQQDTSAANEQQYRTAANALMQQYAGH